MRVLMVMEFNGVAAAFAVLGLLVAELFNVGGEAGEI